MYFVNGIEKEISKILMIYKIISLKINFTNIYFKQIEKERKFALLIVKEMNDQFLQV